MDREKQKNTPEKAYSISGMLRVFASAGLVIFVRRIYAYCLRRVYNKNYYSFCKSFLIKLRIKELHWRKKSDKLLSFMAEEPKNTSTTGIPDIFSTYKTHPVGGELGASA